MVIFHSYVNLPAGNNFTIIKPADSTNKTGFFFSHKMTTAIRNSSGMLQTKAWKHHQQLWIFTSNKRVQNIGSIDLMIRLSCIGSSGWLTGTALVGTSFGYLVHATRRTKLLFITWVVLKTGGFGVARPNISWGYDDDIMGYHGTWSIPWSKQRLGA